MTATTVHYITNDMRTAYFERFTLDIPQSCVDDCSHQGPCDADVAHWAPRVTRPASITPEALRAELKTYGAWDAEQLSDDDANWARLLWLAAGALWDDDDMRRKGGDR